MNSTFEQAFKRIAYKQRLRIIARASALHGKRYHLNKNNLLLLVELPLRNRKIFDVIFQAALRRQGARCSCYLQLSLFRPLPFICSIPPCTCQSSHSTRSLRKRPASFQNSTRQSLWEYNRDFHHSTSKRASRRKDRPR